MYCYYSYGFKNVRNVIKIALKLHFFWRKITKVIQQLGALPPGPSVIRLSCIGLFSTGPKLDNVCTKKILWVQTPYLLTKSWLRFWLRYGFKNVRIMIEMTLNCYLLLQNHKNYPDAGSSAPRPPL